MHRFLELYQEERTPQLPVGQFRELVGDVVVDALLRADILTSGGVARRYPCGLRQPGCPWRVVPNFAGANLPWVAVCGQDSPNCEDVSLEDGEVEEYQMSHERFAGSLRRLMGLEGSFQVLDSTYADTVQLGELRGRDGVRDVFLSLARWGWSCSLGVLLAERMVVPRPSIVFAPTARGIPLSVVHRHGAGSHVVLGILADVLDGRGTELALRISFDALVRSPALAAPVFCVAYTSEGKRSLSRAEYDEILERAHELDLFVDAVVPRHGRKLAAGRRTIAGTVVSVMLSISEARALAELVARGGALAPREFASLKAVGGRAKVVQTARKKVDVKLARYEWRAFHTAIGEGDTDHRYVFRPPPSLRYAVLTSPEST